MKGLKKLLKKIIPASYSKIDSSNANLIELIGEMYKQNCIIINELAQIKNESKAARLELKNEIKLLQKKQELEFYALYRKTEESDLDMKKRFFCSIPDATGGLRLIQKANALLLHEFDKFCKQHNLQYFFAGGNLIGSVRTQKSIPWDDDVDVIMLRSDIDKLIKLTKTHTQFRNTVLFDYEWKCKQIRLYFKDERIPVFLDVFIYDVYQGTYTDNPESYNHIEMTKFFETSDLPEVKYWREHPYLYDNDVYFPKIDAIFDNFSMQKEAITQNYEKYPIKTLIRSCYNINGYPHHRFYDWNKIFPTRKVLFEGYEFEAPNDYMYFLDDNYGDIFSFPKDIFTHIEHISHEYLESTEFKNLMHELFKTYGIDNEQ